MSTALVELALDLTGGLREEDRHQRIVSGLCQAVGADASNLMRLEGRAKEDWEPEIEGARQHYALLAQNSTDEAERAKRHEDLESAIRLARMDLGELQGLPLPSQ